MSSMTLFDLAGRQNEYLAQRQSIIAQNVANANMPGYKARDLQKFDAALDAATSSIPLKTTDPQHLQPVIGPEVQVASVTTNDADVNQSGNNVSLEKEFLKSADVVRSYSLNTQIVKTFNRMMMAAAKS
jgi:flagellar basal-body rod protein FlgB